MRALSFVLLVVAMFTTPIAAQEITLKDLVGTTITSTIWRMQTQKRSDGEKYSGKIKAETTIIFGNPGDTIQVTRTGTWWFGKDGRSGTETSSGSLFIGNVRALPNSGGGYGVGFLQNGTIYYIRTYKSGGFKFEFKLSRTARGLTCTSRETYLKEAGASAILRNSNVSDRPLVIVSDKQISSTCRVTKR